MPSRIEIHDDALAEVLGKDDVGFGEDKKLIKKYLEKNDLIEEDEGGKKYVVVDDLLSEAFNINSDEVTSKDFWFKYVAKAFGKASTKIERYSE